MIDDLAQPLILASARPCSPCGQCSPSAEELGHAAAAAAAEILAKTARKEAPPELVAAFIAALTGSGWRTAAEIAAATGIADRTLRLCAESSAGKILGGQRGYKLTAEATPVEIKHCEAWLLSQAHRMIDRARQIRLEMNRRTFNADKNTL